MALCHITGTVYLPDGQPASNRIVELYKIAQDTVTADYLGAVTPEVVKVRLSSDGEIDVNLITGNYYGDILDRNGKTSRRFKATVPEQAAAQFSDIIEAADPVEPLPAWLQQAWDARDEAQVAELAAYAAADRAEANADRVKPQFDSRTQVVADTTMNNGNTPVGSTISVAGLGQFVRVSTGGSLVSGGGLQFVSVYSVGGLSPDMFGAVGDGVADDTSAVQAAINAAPINGNVAVLRNYKVTTVRLQTDGVTLAGPGSIIGKVILGGDTVKTEGLTVRGVKMFSGVSGKGSELSGAGIAIRSVRGLNIEDCVFTGWDRGVAVEPWIGQVFHSTSTVVITGCSFRQNNYSVHGDYAGTGVDDWMSINDWLVTDNTHGMAYVSHIWFKGVDGLKVSGNICFFTSYNSTDTAALALKDKNISVGQSDWVVITGNHLFEAGTNAIHLSQPRNFDISHNMIPWSGQKDLASSILIDGSGSPSGDISHNRIALYTKYGIEINTNLTGSIRTNITVEDNLLTYSATNPYYYGDDPLSSIEHLDIFVDPASQTRVWSRGNIGDVGTMSVRNRGVNGGQVPLNARSAASGVLIRKAVTAADTPICILRNNNINPSNGAMTSGQLTITAKADSSQAANEASYILHVATTPAGATCVEISKVGLTAGGSALWPSYTWSVDAASGELRASPVGSTSTPNSEFWITSLGDIKCVEISA